MYWNHLGIKKEQLIWNDIITFNSIGNERKQWYQLHGIGCNSYSSSIGGAIDLEWYYLIECNWVSKEQMVSITWNRMQFMDFINWRINWSGITLSLLFNWEWKESMVSITWNSMQFMDFLNWRSNWSGMILSRWMQLGIKGTNGVN